MTNLGDLNTLYNFQNRIILFEIFESRASFLNEKFKFNLRKFNSAGTFSGCVHRDKSKTVIALPANVETVKLIEKTLIRGFRCVNTHLASNSCILFLNEEKKKEQI